MKQLFATILLMASFTVFASDPACTGEITSLRTVTTYDGQTIKFLLNDSCEDQFVIVQYVPNGIADLMAYHILETYWTSLRFSLSTGMIQHRFHHAFTHQRIMGTETRENVEHDCESEVIEVGCMLNTAEAISYMEDAQRAGSSEDQRIARLVIRRLNDFKGKY